MNAQTISSASNWQKYCVESHWHDAAKLFPLINAGELDELACDIKQNRLQNPIVLFEGKVLDGRNRVLACAKVGVKPTFVEWERNGVSEIDFVLSQNLKRRHLTIDQRAALAAEMVPLLAKDACQRQIAAGKHGAEGGRGNKRKKPTPQKCGRGSRTSAAKAARLVRGVSARYVEKVLSLEKKKPGTREKIKKGKLTILEAARAVDKKFSPRPLHEQFVAPPFSVLDAKQGYWQKRKKEWRTLGVNKGHNEQRNGNSQPDTNNASFAGTSVFDPVLAECIYKWFAPKRGHVLDPFAGEATKGIVAAWLEYEYTGLDLRKNQVSSNNRQAALVARKFRKLYGKEMQRPNWIQADSTALADKLPRDQMYDLIFTSPPYFDREIYSTSKKDVSTSESYENFMTEYAKIFQQAVARLRPNRFLVVKVANMRDKEGFFRNFVGDNVSCFQRLGLRFYDDLVLATPIGSAPIRVRAQFSNYRKMVSTHQNVLCFFNGDAKRIPREFGLLGKIKHGKERK
jgi:DNA modification methylase